MKYSELKSQLAKLAQEHKSAEALLWRKYVESNARFEKGDVVKFDGGHYVVIRYGVARFDKSVIYVIGAALTKKMTLRVDCLQRTLDQDFAEKVGAMVDGVFVPIERL